MLNGDEIYNMYHLRPKFMKTSGSNKFKTMNTTVPTVKYFFVHEMIWRLSISFLIEMISQPEVEDSHSCCLEVTIDIGSYNNTTIEY